MDNAPDPDRKVGRSAGLDVDRLPSVGIALLADHARAAQAVLALRDTDGVRRWAVRFGLLGDENRLRLLLALHRAPGITVGDLARAVGMSDNAASHALSALRIAQIVGVSRDGRFRRWSILDPEIHDVLHRVGGSHSDLHPDH